MVVSADVLDEFRISHTQKNGESMAVICRRLNDDSDGMVSEAEERTVTIIYRVCYVLTGGACGNMLLA